jgi:hypothetical protein
LSTNVYIDAFNLYYGCLKGTPYKWLDLGLLCRLLLPGYSVNQIRYFTAFRSEYETAVVISNDSDLKAPIEAVRTEFGLRVGVAIPSSRVRRSALPADFYRRIRKGALASSQFPMVLRDERGAITRPPTW